MATVPPLPLSLNTARATFGQGPGSLNAMRRGAGIVPNIPGNNGVPTAAPIALSDLVGATTEAPPTVELLPASASHSALSPNSATARLQFNGTQVQRITGVSTVNLYQWLLSGSASDYAARATVIGGTVPSGPLNTWEVLGGTVGWQLTQSSNGSSNCDLLIEIRPAGGGAVVASAAFTLSATRSSV